MRVSRRLLVVASFVSLSLCPPAVTFAQSSISFQSSDQAVAQRLLGPQWLQLSRRAGMIFAGTVLNDALPGAEPVAAGAMPFSVQFRFRVDHAIAGVERGQIVTIHEWAGALSLQRPMVGGQHLLLLLYAPSRLGLTSPVGGPAGQILLDSRGEYVSQDEFLRRNAASLLQNVPYGISEPPRTLSVDQLERAIRGARKE